MVAPRRDWMHTIPPWRIPMPRGHRHHRHHVDFGDLIVGFMMLMGWLLILEIGIGLWMLELEVWLIVWFCYGLFLGGRALWRGAAARLGRRAAEQQTAWLAGARTGEELTKPWPAQDGTQQADPWDTGTMRRRGRT